MNKNFDLKEMKWKPNPYIKPPATPGEILREESLKPFGITQRQLAKHHGCGVSTIHRMMNGRSPLTAQLAVKLDAAFKTSPEFWMNAQQAVELHTTKRKLQKLPAKLMS